MVKKVDKAAVKQEGESLKVIIAQARKKPLNFALLQGKEGMFLETHLKKNPNILRKEAKKKGGGPKCALGQMKVEGKIIIFLVAEEPPGPFPKLTKKYFTQRGLPMQVRFRLPSGAEFGAEEDGDGDSATAIPAKSTPKGEAPKTPAKPAKKPAGDSIEKKLLKAFAAMKPDLEVFLKSDVQSIKSTLTTGIATFKTMMASKIYAEAAKQLKALQITLKQLKAHAKAQLEKDKTNKEKLKDFKIPEDKKNTLVKLAQTNPKAFTSAVKALALLGKNAGDIVPTAAGIAAAELKLKDLKADKEKQAKKFKELGSATKLAEEAAKKSGKKNHKAALKLGEAEKARRGWGTTSDSDLAKMSPDSRKRFKAMIKRLDDAIIKARQESEAASREKATADAKFNTAKAGLAAQKTKNTAAEKKFKKYGKNLKGAKKQEDTEKKMLASLQGGALSPHATKPLKPEDVAKVLSSFETGTNMGAAAIGLIETSKNKANVIDGIDRLVKGAANSFKDKDGKAYGSKVPCDLYASRALKMGDAMGGDYFKDMDAFIKKGGMKKPDPVPTAGAKTMQALGQKRAKYVGDAMLGPDGKIDTGSGKAKNAMDMMKFHPSTLTNSMPRMNQHFTDMSKTLSTPHIKANCNSALDGITAPPTSTTGKNLVAKATGKAANALTKDDVKSSVMSAMFTPLDQGSVGSCFSVGPARRQRMEDPAKVMLDYTEIATKGTFTKPDGTKIPAIKPGKIPAGENPIMRSHEYTVATAAAQEAGSRERKQLKKNLFGTGGGGNDLDKIKSLLPNAKKAKWPEIRVKLQEGVKTKLTFKYNATSSITDSKDGSSTNGNFEIFDKETKKSITTKADFIKVITRLALAAASETKDTDTGKKIINHVKSDAFINAVCPGKYKPWELPGGGFDDTVVKVLEGGNPQYADMIGNQPAGQSSGKRTKDLAAALIKNFKTQPADKKLTDIGNDRHAFGGTPNHPSLEEIKKEADPKKAIDKFVIKPGEKLANTKMDKAKAGVLFDKQINAAEKWNKDPFYVSLIQTARLSRPTTDMSPKELKKAIETAMKPLRDFVSKKDTDKWKAGKTPAPSDADYQKELAKTKAAFKKAASDTFDNNVIADSGAPQFVLADANWGTTGGHTFFVMIPDPATGQPKLYQRTDPSGKLSALDDKWIKANWMVVK